MVAPQDLDGNPSLPEENILSQILVVPQIDSAEKNKETMLNQALHLETQIIRASVHGVRRPLLCIQ